MALCFTTLFLGAGIRAHAQLTLTLPSDPLPIDAATGGTATFFATLTNDYSYDLFLNSDAYVLHTPADLNDTPFQSYFVSPPNGIQPTLAANGGTLTVELFSVSLPPDTSPGIYSGSITLQGGPTQLDTDNLAMQQFAVSAVPEPGSTALLCGAGMTALYGLRRRARRRFSA